MGDRFYQQQLRIVGDCPGANKTQQRRSKKVAWTDEKKKQAVELYLAQDPTPETTLEVLAQVAEELEESVNGTRIILSKAEVYVKKDGGSAPAKGGAEKSANPRVSKDDAISGLRGAIEDLGQEVDEAIITKLTGKAAIYFTKVLTSVK